MQNLQAERPDLPVALFAAGLPTSAAVINNAVTNAERFDYRSLGSLTADSAAIALVGPARNLDVAWDRDAVDLAVRLADGYPHTIQLIGEHAWIAAGRPDRGDVITVAHVRQGQRKVDASMKELFEARMARVSTPAQREFVEAMAELGDGPVPRSAIAARLGVANRSISETRSQLLGAGVIADVGRGVLTFGVPGFAAHIREESRRIDSAHSTDLEE